MTCNSCQFDSDDLRACACGVVLCPDCRREHTCKPLDVQLRGYQSAMVNATHDALRRVQRVVSVAPTGAGKRYLAVWWCRGIQDRGRRVLVVGDRRILVRQMQDELQRHGVDYGIIMADVTPDRNKPVQVASIHTLRSRHLATGEGLPPADWVIVDEAHKEPAAYKRLMSHYPNAKWVGLTATPVGPQGTTLLGPGHYDELVEGVANSRLIADRWLLSTHVLAPSEPNIEGVTISGGAEYNQEQLGVAVESCTVFANVFKEWEPYSDRKTIVFAPLVKYCNGLAEQFNQRCGAGTAAVIEGATDRRERDELFERFDSGDLRVLVSVDVLREGFDCNASCGIDLQPNHQLRTFVQKTGRIRRQRHTHRHAIWLDFAGNYWRFPHPDEDVPWAEVTGETTTADVARQQKEKSESKPMECPACGIRPLRWINGLCPNPDCDHKLRSAKRHVRMENGRLVAMPLGGKKKKKAAERSGEQKQWDHCFYMAKNSRSGMTFKSARGQYRRQYHRDPPSTLENVPPDGHVDWERRVQDVTRAEMARWQKKKEVPV